VSLIRASIPPASVQEGPAAIVLSGGGARGGYEAGVLRYLFGDFAKKHGIPQFQIVSGTSVGAINGAYLASVLDDPVPGVQRLTQLWSELELERVIGFGMLQATRLPRVLLGGQKGGGIFDVTPLTKIVGENMRWAQLARNIRRGVLRALTISATHVATGRPWCFVDRAPDVPLPTGMPPTMVVRADRIGPQHVLASAAIPVMFPPVPVHGDLFVDGGLRLNTPMSPAVHMGARRLLVIGLTNAPHAPAVPAFEPGIFPGVAFLLGKVLNAFLLDHVNADFLELERWNRTLDDGMRIYGPDFVDRLAQAAIERGAPPRYRLHAMAIHPSSDIGRLASRHMRNHEARFGKLLGRGLLRLLDLGEGADADLVSYLLFDGEFAKQLMELGEHDARQREAELVRFFRGTASSAGIVIPPEREPA
jgi:NTE family protein